MKNLVHIFLFLALLNLSPECFAAPKLCKNKVTSGIFLRDKCRPTESRINFDSLGLKGSDGADGADGSNAPSPYGDGSSGALLVSSGSFDLFQPGQYTTCTIAAGAQLNIGNGGILRCRDSFTNNGTVIGGVSNTIGQPPVWEAGSAQVLFQVVGVGFGTIAPGIPGYGQTGQQVLSARGGLGRGFPYTIFRSETGGGPSSYNHTVTGGGTSALMIYSGGPIINASGALLGDGSLSYNDGSGGAVIILASKVSVTNAGTIEASGHDGMDSNSRDGCGGGGGGFVRLIAPTTSNTGTINVAGGVKGTALMMTTLFPKIGGPGGGASYGNGGDGCGFASSSDTPSGGTNGSAGLSLSSEIDPTPFL